MTEELSLSFTHDQSAKFFFFCAFWRKKYFRFAGGKAEPGLCAQAPGQCGDVLELAQLPHLLDQLQYAIPAQVQGGRIFKLVLYLFKAQRILWTALGVLPGFLNHASVSHMDLNQSPEFSLPNQMGLDLVQQILQHGVLDLVVGKLVQRYIALG